MVPRLFNPQKSRGKSMGHLREREGVKKADISAVTLYSQLQVTTQKNVIHRRLLRTLNNCGYTARSTNYPSGISDPDNDPN